MQLPKQNMLYYERMYWQHGFDTIAGIDEAGRGPLAGPVVAAAVILPRDHILPEIDDSKAMTAKKRRKIFDWICEKAKSIGVGVVWQNEIDRINILNATMKTMTLATKDLDITPDFVLIDGNRKPDLGIPSRAIIGGDGKSFSIAAASIIAKVTRDDIMIEFSSQYPQYNFEQNKGYPTKKHREAIECYGPCPLHRHSFRLVAN